jgi:2-keto-3-deoxy-L-rhamnonate aldolase RhmA
MRINALRALFGRTRPAIGVMADLASERVVEFYGIMGYDWVLIDAEHDGVGVDTCYSFVRAADAVGIASVVRVPANRADIILSYAETGVSGIMVPHVRSAADAEAFVSALRYPPRGTRGIAGVTRASNYGLTSDPKSYFLDRDSGPVGFALLEDAEAYEPDELDRIAAVDGVDVICLGTGDLAASLGFPGEKDHPEVVRRAELAVAAAKRHGKRIEMSVGAVDPAGLETAARYGAGLVFTSNAGLMTSAGRQFLKAARAALAD